MHPLIDGIQSALPGLKIQSTRSHEEGWDFHVLEVNEEWIFRFPRRPREMERLKREADFLEKAAPDLPVAVPRYEVLHLREPLPFGGYRKLPGTPLSAATGSFSAVTLRELGQFLSALHRMDNFPDLPGEAGWMEKYRVLEEWAAEALFPSMEASRREGLEKLFQHLHREMGKAHLPLCPIHGDLSAAHLLGGEHHLTGVIDWGDACIGDPAHDFAALWLEFGESTARGVARHYSGLIDPSFWMRADLYRRLAPVYGWLHDGERGDPCKTD
ncbi:aminoglycoside phosphotransferase family protein [Desmospora sp. 8437]|nr:aminoglycoside phosphotransferase family protein [Desmospora sp. 8437]